MDAEPTWVYLMAGAAALALLIYLLIALFNSERMS